MRAIRISILLLVAMGGPSAAADHPLRGVALVIGESAYAGGLPALDNPKRDARAMDDLFDSLGFSVDRVLDASGYRLRAGIAGFIDDAKGADVALVYYSGHGIEAGGENFLAPTDADLSTPQRAGTTLVALSSLLDELAKTVPVTIVLLDACRTNAFPPGTAIALPGSGETLPVGATGLGEVRGPTPLARQGVSADSLGMVIGFAASPGQPALDGAPGENSPYAAALLKHFGAGGYSIGDLMTMVSEEVYLKTRARQLPWTNSSLRRVLSFGQPVEPQAGDAAEIRDGRRRLLLTIARQPEDTRRYVESVATEEGVPLDALYGMLKVLGVDTSGGKADLEAELRDGAQKLKDFMAEKPGAAKTDPELLRLSGLADEAQKEGAIDLALKYRGEASSRADELAAAVDKAEAGIAQDRQQIGETYAEHARTASLNFDFATAAEMAGKAYEQVARWDPEAAFRYKRDQGDALYQLGRYKGGSEALEQAIAVFGEAEVLTDEGSPDWRSIQIDLGNAYSTLGERQSGNEGLDAAIEHYNKALTPGLREANPAEWAGTEGNIGVALMYLGQHEQGTGHLEQAADALKQASGAIDRDASPVRWGLMQTNLGNVYEMLGDRTGEDHYYVDAMLVQRAALDVLTRENGPLNWAGAQNNLGNSLARIGEGEDGTESLEGAVAAFRAALEERTRDKVAVDWAATEDNLGSALSTLGERTASDDLMAQAIDAFSAALEVRTHDTMPLDWALTLRNRGIAYKKLGQFRDDPGAYDSALADYEAALTVFDRDATPMDWAQTEADIGIAALARANSSGARQDLLKARDAYAAAFEIYGTLGQDWHDYFAGKIADIDERLGN